MSGRDSSELTRSPALAGTDPLDEISTFAPHSRGMLQIVSVPIVLAGSPPDVLGRLTVGFFLDDQFAAQIKRLTGSEIAFGARGRIFASTLPVGSAAALAGVMGASQIAPVRIGNEDFLALARPLAPRDRAAGVEPVALTLRSRTERLRV
jgi:hypothetical protein